MRKALATAFFSVVALMAFSGVAEAAIPASLKTSCVTRTPHAGYSYKFCDDGVPTVGGITANSGGVSAVTVPAAYDGYAGLPSKDLLAAMNTPGHDANGDIALDVDVSIPTSPAPAGGYPVVVMMHGCCSGDKKSWEDLSFDGGGEKWHYNNAWFASRGYVVVTYTARGFVNGSNQGSTGETQLDSKLFEINDYQHLVGQLADDPFFSINPQRIVTTGGSYGGGFSWLTLTDPFWQSPNGVNMKLVATAPKYGWTDLVYSLVTTGKHSHTTLPAFDGSSSTTPIGIPKKTIVQLLYDSGKTGIPPGTPHTTFSTEIDQAFGCLNSTDPYETNPLCTNVIASTLPSFISDRSAYYQSDFFNNIVSDPNYRIPIFNAATLTDPLFTPIENLRMYNRLRQAVPSYPIQQYYGDYQHFVQNKAKEWGDLCAANHHVCTFADYPGGNLNGTPTGLFRTGVTTRLNRFIDHYAQPSGNPSEPAPSFDVTASLQVCPANAAGLGVAADEPGPAFNASTFTGLAPNVLQLEMTGNRTTVNNASPNLHAESADPLNNQLFNNKACPVEPASNSDPGAGVAQYDSAPLATQYTMIGGTTITIDYNATTANGLQLNARLYDVFPNGDALMVDRGARRVESASGQVTYQLHGNGWRFPAGHKVRIEVAQDDDPYLRSSTVASSATISQVTLQIPVREATAYVRPKGATPALVSLVPAFQQCASPGNRQHGGPLTPSNSCNPATESSSTLWFGTPDANGQVANGSGSVRLDVCPVAGCAAPDVKIMASLADVRNRDTNRTDYTGELQGRVTLRVTDKRNGPAQDEPGTMVDTPFGFTIQCADNGDPASGGSCSVSTTANAVVPSALGTNTRAIWELGQIQVLDGGADGDIDTGPNTVFARQGIFIP